MNKYIEIQKKEDLEFIERHIYECIGGYMARNINFEMLFGRKKEDLIFLDNEIRKELKKEMGEINFKIKKEDFILILNIILNVIIELDIEYGIILGLDLGKSIYNYKKLFKYSIGENNYILDTKINIQPY